MCGGEPEQALPAALAIEVLHNFTLVHDDIMDRAETRRGEPSVYKKWNQDIAILSGDVMFADAYQRLGFYGSDDSYSKQEFAAIHRIFSTAAVTVCEGQALDMEFMNREAVSRDEYLTMIRGKTAALLSAAFEIGALAGHASPQKRAKLAELGQIIGTAFQIQDDLLDATADPEKFGKRAGGDIYEGKKTYLTILALEQADTKQSQIIRETLKNRECTHEQVQTVLQIIAELGVLDKVAQEIDAYYNKAFELIHEFESSEYQQELEKLLIFLQNRDH